jgi:2-dehydropantoate 2-reductase
MKKILIFGAGVIGSVYAGKLALAGHRVSVLARNERLSELQLNGLLLSENGKKTVKPNVTVISELKTDDVYDYIFVTLRKDQVSDALLLLSQNQSKNFVFMVNTASGYADWIGQIGLERVIPAFPGAGGKVENGIVYFSLTSRFVQPTTLGEIDGKATQRISELVEILRNAGFPTSISKKMDRWQKSHVAMVCSLAYGIYFDGGNNYTFSKNKPAIIQTNRALKETFSFINNSGIGIEPVKLNLFRIIPLPILNFFMRLIFNTKWAETVISNHALAARDEMEMLFNEFILLAEGKGYNLNELKELWTSTKQKTTRR